jgi:hypothetical protein
LKDGLAGSHHFVNRPPGLPVARTRPESEVLIVLSEYVGYLVAQQQSRITAGSALPDAPVVSANARRSSAARIAPVGAWLGAELRRLADRLAPRPHADVPMALPRH